MDLLEVLLLLLLSINSIVLYSSTFYKMFYDYYIYLSAFIILIMVVIQSQKYNKKIMIFSFFIILFTLVATRFNGLALGELYPIFLFVVVVLSMMKIKNEKKFSRYFFIVNICVWIYLIVYVIVFKDNIDVNLGGMPNGVTSSLLNTNTIGMGLIINYWLIRYGIEDSQNKKILSFFILIGTIIGLLICDCRTAIISLVCSLLLNNLFGHFLKKTKKFSILLFAFVCVMGVVYPIIYVMAWLEYGGDLMLGGKYVFSGRERIWGTLFAYMQNNPFSYVVGTGKVEMLFWHDTFNLHNGFLAIGAEYGGVVLLLFIMGVLYMIVRPYKVYTNLPQKIICLYMCLLVLLLESYSETVFTYYLSTIYPAMVIGLMNVNRIEKNNL